MKSDTRVWGLQGLLLTASPIISGEIFKMRIAVISQDGQQVECRRRTSNNTWETTVYGKGDSVSLDSIGLEFAIGELYRGVDA